MRCRLWGRCGSPLLQMLWLLPGQGAGPIVLHQEPAREDLSAGPGRKGSGEPKRPFGEKAAVAYVGPCKFYYFLLCCVEACGNFRYPEALRWTGGRVHVARVQVGFLGRLSSLVLVQEGGSPGLWVSASGSVLTPSPLVPPFPTLGRHPPPPFIDCKTSDLLSKLCQKRYVEGDRRCGTEKIKRTGTPFLSGYLFYRARFRLVLLF